MNNTYGIWYIILKKKQINLALSKLQGPIETERYAESIIVSLCFVKLYIWPIAIYYAFMLDHESYLLITY